VKLRHKFNKKGKDMSNGTAKQTEIVKQDDKPFAVRYTPFGEKNEISRFSQQSIPPWIQGINK
jgi:hypothetical protein